MNQVNDARDNGIHGASFTAIGACRRATIAYWNPDTKGYETIEVDEQASGYLVSA